MTLRDLTEHEVAKLRAQAENDWQNFVSRLTKTGRGRLEGSEPFPATPEFVKTVFEQGFSDGLKAFLAVQPPRSS